MPSKMVVASQHWTEWTDWTDCTKQNKRHFYTIKIEKIFIHDSRVQHPVLSSVRGTLLCTECYTRLSCIKIFSIFTV